MIDRRRLTFSLATLLLLVVIVAQIVSQVIMMRQLTDARAEVEEVRRKFGYIRVENEDQVFVARVSDEGNEDYRNTYRIHIPAGHHYMLHLTDTIFETEDFPMDVEPTKTLSMNSWKEGADVLIQYSITSENGTRRVRVWTETLELFDHRMDGFPDPPGMGDGSHLVTDPQKAFSPDETIRFFWSRNLATHRGVMLWMEPVSAWIARHPTE